MTSTPLVVLDACVLANFSLCATLSYVSRKPHGCLRLGWPSTLTAYFETELRTNFSEAWISGYEPLIPRMTNDEKDRHVVAAAVHGEAPIIVTLNLRHFRREHLEPWGISALHPQSFLAEIYDQEQALVMTKLEQQAAGP